jgi:hypothetical protein
MEIKLPSNSICQEIFAGVLNLATFALDVFVNNVFLNCRNLQS